MIILGSPSLWLNLSWNILLTLQNRDHLTLFRPQGAQRARSIWGLEEGTRQTPARSCRFAIKWLPSFYTAKLDDKHWRQTLFRLTNPKSQINLIILTWRNATWSSVNLKFNVTRNKNNQDGLEQTGKQVSGKVHYGLGYSHWGVGAWVGTLTKHGQ